MTVYAMRWAKPGRPSSGSDYGYFPMKSAEAFKRGDPVKLDTNGQLLIAVDTEGSIGIADDDASNYAALDNVPVILHNVDDWYSASISAAGATATSAQTDCGLRCSYIKSTITGETAKTVVDRSDTQADVLHVIGFLDPVGTVDGRVYFRWEATQRIPRGT